MDEAGRPGAVVAAPARVTRAELLRGNVIGCLTAIYDTETFGKVEMPDIRRRQDYGLWLRLLARVPAAHGLPEVLADYRVRRGLAVGQQARRGAGDLAALPRGRGPVAAARELLFPALRDRRRAPPAAAAHLSAGVAGHACPASYHIDIKSYNFRR